MTSNYKMFSIFTVGLVTLILLSALAWAGQGNINNSLSFADSNVFAKLTSEPGAIRSNRNWTAEFWFKTGDSGTPNGTYGYQIKEVVYGQGDFMIQHLHLGVANGYLAIEWYYNGGSSGIQGNIFVSDNNWHHAAFVGHDNGTVELYVDGIYDVSGAFAHDTANPTTALIGNEYQSYNGWYGYTFNGQVDELRIWNEARTQTQLQANMASEISAQPGLIGYWKFNEALGNILTDSSGAGNNGTLGLARTSGAPLR